ncbi:Uncharacterized protein YyaT [Grifola frondosa]|uniref:Uncharacterized protein YyaT n=1 Tax=Grifola frondosa TaxID=5627 RepID=A0A1C7MI85_GRIFR|nr:Uncharacterized protein YyaT [Grifola frondosa]
MPAATPAHELVVVPAAGQPARTALLQQCFDTEIDDFEEDATHILLRLVPSLEPVGTIRCVKTKNYYKLSRLAVLRDHREHRFGRALVLALHDHVKADAKICGLAPSDTVSVISHSQIPVKGFYAKFGYVPEGEEFDEDGAPHQKMVARLSLSD